MPVRANRKTAAPWNSAPRTVPHYINEDKSDMRGIKSGWYAIDEDGNLVSGPFDTYDQCVERNALPTYLMLARSISNLAILDRGRLLTPLAKSTGPLHEISDARQAALSRRRFYMVGRLAENDAQQRAVDFKMAVVVNKSQFAKLVHEMVHV